MQTVIHRIYTEDVNRERIVTVLDRLFSGYTLMPGQGRYMRVSENSLVIEIMGADPTLVKAAAKHIGRVNNQHSVFTTEHTINIDYISTGIQHTVSGIAV